MGFSEQGSIRTEEKEEINNGETEKKPFKPKIVWFNAIGMLFIHLCAVYGLFLLLTFQTKLLTAIWAIFFAYISGTCVTMGAHRLFTHRSYKATLPLRLILVLGQTLAGQNCLWVWVRDHRQHHKYSDTDADPHNSTRGFFFCHVGWLIMKKHPDVISKGKKIDMSDIEADKLIMFQKKYYKPLYLVFAFLLPSFAPYFLWGETFNNCLFVCYFARYLTSVNGTWCVNSVAHMFGNRPYSKEIAPVESSWVSWIGSGEGWHNYHHTFPWDYRASEYGMRYNTTRQLLDFFSKIGWAYDLKSASPSMVKNRILNHGDGTHPIVQGGATSD